MEKVNDVALPVTALSAEMGFAPHSGIVPCFCSQKSRIVYFSLILPKLTQRTFRGREEQPRCSTYLNLYSYAVGLLERLNTVHKKATPASQSTLEEFL